MIATCGAKGHGGVGGVGMVVSEVRAIQVRVLLSICLFRPYISGRRNNRLVMVCGSRAAWMHQNQPSTSSIPGLGRLFQAQLLPGASAKKLNQSVI